MPGHGCSQFFLNSPWTCPLPSVAFGCAARAAGIARGPHSVQPAAPPPHFTPTSASPIPFCAVSAPNEGNLPPRGSFPKQWDRRDSRGTRFMSSETRTRHPEVSPHHLIPAQSVGARAALLPPRVLVFPHIISGSSALPFPPPHFCAVGPSRRCSPSPGSLPCSVSLRVSELPAWGSTTTPV